MLDAANEALGFIQGKNRSDLDTDRMLVLSLVKELEIIGEAATTKYLPKLDPRAATFRGKISAVCAIV
jgi:uncharacterized protein with HEPN domain